MLLEDFLVLILKKNLRLCTKKIQNVTSVETTNFNNKQDQNTVDKFTIMETMFLKSACYIKKPLLNDYSIDAGTLRSVRTSIIGPNIFQH